MVEKSSGGIEPGLEPIDHAVFPPRGSVLIGEDEAPGPDK